jgi:hypothetical protein
VTWLLVALALCLGFCAGYVLATRGARKKGLESFQEGQEVGHMRAVEKYGVAYGDEGTEDWPDRLRGELGDEGREREEQS